MNKLIFLVSFILCGMQSFSQIYVPKNPTVYGNREKRFKADSSIGFPSKDTLLSTSDISPQIFYRPIDSTFYGWSLDKGFFKIGSGNGTGTDNGSYHSMSTSLDSMYGILNRPNGTKDSFMIVADGMTGGSSTYTASNGLTMVGNDIQLGGSSLSKNDTINTNTFGLKLIGNTTNALEINQFGSGGLGISVSTNGGTGISSQSGNNTGGNFLGSSIGIATQSPNIPLWVINSNTSNSGILNAITIQRDVSTPTVDGFGIGISFSGVTSDMSTTYLGLIQYDFSSNRNYNTSIGRFSLIVADSAKSNNKVFQINGTGQATLNRYGTGLFTGTLKYNLGVDASGNVIEVASPTVSTGTATPASTPTKIGDIYIDTTAKKLYFASGTSSSADWIITN